MDRVFISLFGFNIYWYAVLILIAMIIGIYLVNKEANKVGISSNFTNDLVFYTIPIAIIGARIYYVIFNFKVYKNDLLSIFKIWNGGLAIYGGIIAGIIFIYFYCKKHSKNVLKVLDVFAPSVILGQAIGRWGNFFNQEAYGMQTNSIFRMGIIENGRYIEVHPTFLYESICNFGIFIILFWIKDKRKYKGQLTYLYLTLYSFIRAIIEGLRTDSLMLGNIRISQL